MKYLMVCLGNICRSPMAEGLLRRKLNDIGSRSTVDSCGFEPYHIGDSPDARAQKTMMEHGIDICGHKARLFHPDDFNEFDLIFAMDKFNYGDIKRMAGGEENMKKVDLLVNVLYPGENRVVPDPYYGNADGFENTYAVLDKALDALISKYEK